MKRLFVVAALAALLLGSAFATEGSRMVCPMTGETVDPCCVKAS